MSELRIAVLGVGMMGADHVARITSKITVARVTVVNDYITEKAEQMAEAVPGCPAAPSCAAPPGPTTKKQLLACFDHGKPVICEKPLTTDVVTSLEVVKREA